VANDGETALRQVSEQAVEVIILDMNLPPLNGLETYLAIRRVRPHAVVLLLTGFRIEMSGIVDQALEQSVYTCLEKPVDIDQLLYLLERIKSQKAQGCIEKPGTITS
jgi:DNA-binding NtrC family response regulator